MKILFFMILIFFIMSFSWIFDFWAISHPYPYPYPWQFPMKSNFRQMKASVEVSSSWWMFASDNFSCNKEISDGDERKRGGEGVANCMWSHNRRLICKWHFRCALLRFTFAFVPSWVVSNETFFDSMKKMSFLNAM